MTKINTAKEMQDTLNQYKADMEIMSKDLSGWDRRTLNGMMMGQRQAADDLKVMKTKYTKLLQQSSAVYLVYGGKAKDYTKLTNVFKDLGYNPFTESTMSLYERLYPRVEENVDRRKREYNNHCLMTLTSELAVLGKEMGLDSFLEPTINVVFGVPTAHDTLMAVRSSLMINNGHLLTIEYMTQDYIKKALDSGHTADVTPVIIKCLDENEAKELSTQIYGTIAMIDLDETKLDTEFEKTIKKSLSKNVAK